MSWTDLYPWLVFLHVTAAFAFAAGHGVSIVVAFRLRAERDPRRMAALLDLSALSLTLAGVGLLVLLVTGIAAGIIGGSFGRAWIWISLVLLVVVGGFMTPLGGTWFRRLREALGQGSADPMPGEPEAAAVGAAELAALLDNRRPEMLAAIGGVGFVAILWLMMFKPV